MHHRKDKSGLHTALDEAGQTENSFTYLVFLQHHKIEMFDPLFRVFSHPLDKRRIRNDVANILVNECIPFIGSGSERTTCTLIL